MRTASAAQAEGPYDDGVKAYNARDYQNAATWFRQAADQGHPQAQMLLGMMSYWGQGMPQDYSAAAGWYLKAAEQGLPHAQTNLGVMYSAGRGVPQDYQAAAKWFQEAADQGETSAQANLAGMYEKGEGVPRDYLMAHIWLDLAVECSTPTQAAFRSEVVQRRDAVAKFLTSTQLEEARRLAREWKPKSR